MRSHPVARRLGGRGDGPHERVRSAQDAGPAGAARRRQRLDRRGANRSGAGEVVLAVEYHARLQLQIDSGTPAEHGAIGLN